MAPAPVRCRLRTPTAAQGGWDSPYTIFESHLGDRPFIVDTIRELFHRRGIPVRHLLHPICSVERDGAGSLVRMRSPEGRQESFVHCAIDRIADAELPGLERELAARLAVIRSAVEATVHRAARMDVVVVRSPADPGLPACEHRFYGLFTNKAYAAPPAEIPVVRRKLQQILAGEQAVPDSHDYREIE